MDEYRALVEELANKPGQKICNLDKETFWVPWELTGAFKSLEDAREKAIAINEHNEVIWRYSLEQLKELLNK